MKYIAFTFVFLVLLLCSCRNHAAPSSDVQTEDTLRTITEEMAYEGVNNYCHSTYDWSVAKDHPDIMYLTMGEETDSAYQVVQLHRRLCTFLCRQDKWHHKNSGGSAVPQCRGGSRNHQLI